MCQKDPPKINLHPRSPLASSLPFLPDPYPFHSSASKAHFQKMEGRPRPALLEPEGGGARRGPPEWSKRSGKGRPLLKGVLSPRDAENPRTAWFVYLRDAENPRTAMIIWAKQQTQEPHELTEPQCPWYPPRNFGEVPNFFIFWHPPQRGFGKVPVSHLSDRKSVV